MSTAAYDVLIVGAGIVGCACARECARAGLRTAVVESRWPGGATTAAGMGHIVVMDDSPAQLALTEYSRRLWSDLADELPAAAEYQTPGTLWVAADEEEMREVHAKRNLLERAGIAAETIGPERLAKLEPQLRPGMAGALLVPDDAVVYPPAVATHLLASAPGVPLLRDQSVAAAGRNSVTLSDGTVLRAGWVILATGSDCSLLPTLPIQKRKGHLLITDRYPGFVRHQLVELGYLKSAHKLAGDSVAFNIQPRQTGQMLIGSSRQYGTGDPAIEPHMLRQMLDRAVSYLPALAHLSGIRAWAGFRAATPDKLPLVGRSEAFGGDASLQLAMGFEGLGITTCLGAAELLVDSLLGRPSAIDRAPYDPARFAGSLSAEAIHA